MSAVINSEPSGRSRQENSRDYKTITNHETPCELFQGPVEIPGHADEWPHAKRTFDRIDCDCNLLKSEPSMSQRKPRLVDAFLCAKQDSVPVERVGLLT